MWLDATTGVDQLAASITTMLASSPFGGAEEWAILDTDGFHGIAIDPHDELADVVEIADGIGRLGPAFAAWFKHFGPELPDLASQFEAAFLGEHWGTEGYARDVFDDDIHDVYDATRWSPLSPYVQVDVTRLTGDLIRRGEIVALDAEQWNVWVFAGNGVPDPPDGELDDWHRG